MYIYIYIYKYIYIYIYIVDRKKILKKLKVERFSFLIQIFIYQISDMVFKDFPFTKLFCDFSSCEFLNHHQYRIIFTLQKTADLVTFTE